MTMTVDAKSPVVILVVLSISSLGEELPDNTSCANTERRDPTKVERMRLR